MCMVRCFSVIKKKKKEVWDKVMVGLGHNDGN